RVVQEKRNVDLADQGAVPLLAEALSDVGDIETAAITGDLLHRSVDALSLGTIDPGRGGLNHQLAARRQPLVLPDRLNDLGQQIEALFSPRFPQVRQSDSARISEAR